MKMAKIFQNGQSQAVRLPKAFRFQSDEVYIKKVGNAVVLIPEEDPWQSLQQGLREFSVDFMQTRSQPIQHQKREDLFE